MVMDARWKVYVQDRRFDDNQISNVYLKLKWETVGRFSFDFRPIDGDESYMVANNTLRIFWGDLHKLDGVIQRVDWDSTQWCYHIYGADIRGLLLERVNTEPATVHSYTSDVQTQVMFEGCDFPTNIWTGSGDTIGKYTFRYHIGIQNTIRITSATQRWVMIVERGTVYEHRDGCLYDATKNWVPQEYAGATLRFVSGACKNNVYNINGNTSNKVCIRLPGESASDYAVDAVRWKQFGTQWYYNLVTNADFETATTSPWTISFEYPAFAWTPSHYATTVTPASTLLSASFGTQSARIFAETAGIVTYGYTSMNTGTSPLALNAGDVVEFAYRWETSAVDSYNGHAWVNIQGATDGGWLDGPTIKHNASWPDWDVATHVLSYSGGAIQFGVEAPYGGHTYMDVDNVGAWSATGGTPVFGTVPGCSRIGDIYEIVTYRLIGEGPQLFAPATLEQDNHIIHYNLTDDQSEHTTSMTVRGTG